MAKGDFRVTPHFGLYRVIDERPESIEKARRNAFIPSLGRIDYERANKRDWIVAYSTKSNAKLTAEGLSRIKKPENVEKMIKRLNTERGYDYYIRKAKKK